ncbi:hypothetical protein SUGI_1044780 [Cryptomeria japonica]|uniref:RING-H2 finger protein ATL70 n=1 Tax=Cryptomeria japonica TaxID=3369 RepID=UPI002414CC0E|nr:RING-H2 finger protein ATL70 [Cryptomeria japonica]GLJ49381.1 hypothetical protein SUGI_1044780 [Cryptomeria japonica]
MSRNSTEPGTGTGAANPRMGSALALGIVFLLTALILFAVFIWVRVVRRQVSPQMRRAMSNGGTGMEPAEVGLDPETLESYPKVVYSEKLCRTKSEAQERSCCSICLNDYQESEDILRLLPDCGHMFHVECIDQWLKLHPTCPMCRTSPLPSPIMSPLPSPLSQALPLVRHDSLSVRQVSFADHISVQV